MFAAGSDRIFIPGQRAGPPQPRPRRRLPTPRHPAPTHPALPPPHQRQSRAVYRILLDEAVYTGQTFTHSTERRDAIDTFNVLYNHHRPHRALNGHTPAERLASRIKTTAAYS
jgi:hypothetical protein